MEYMGYSYILPGNFTALVCYGLWPFLKWMIKIMIGNFTVCISLLWAMALFDIDDNNLNDLYSTYFNMVTFYSFVESAEGKSRQILTKVV